MTLSSGASSSEYRSLNNPKNDYLFGRLLVMILVQPRGPIHTALVKLAPKDHLDNGSGSLIP